jgi:reactive chlorine resistance protein C
MTGRVSDEFANLRTRSTSKSFAIFQLMAKTDGIALAALRTGLVIVLLWIGGLKFASYEGESIVPFVANSPLLSFSYSHPASEYKTHMSREGELVAANREWHEGNRTYLVSHALGVVIVTLGVLIALNGPLPQFAAVGSALLVGMSFVTLSFLVTTPEVWVPAAGDATHGFPYLSGAGRLVVKDFIMLGAALVTMADSAKTYLRRRQVG